MVDSLTHTLAVVQNGWAAFSLVSTLFGLGGIGLIVAALVLGAYLPAFVRHGLIAAGAVILVAASCYARGQAKGAHEALALDAKRAVAAEAERADAAERRAAADRRQADADLAAARADLSKLKDINDALAKDPHRDRECLDRSLARRLRAL